MSKTTNSEYMLLFRGTDWHEGLSPEEMQEVVKQMYGWFDRLTAQARRKQEDLSSQKAKLFHKRKAALSPTAHSQNLRKRSAGFSCSKWVASTRPQRLPKIFRA